MRPVETSIALGLVLVAGIVVAAPLVPRVELTEERCAPPVPGGEATALTPDDRITNEVGFARRVVEFAPESWPTRALVRGCDRFFAEVASAEGDRRGALRVTVRAWGEDPHSAVEDVEVKARAVVVDGTLVFVPRIQMRAFGEPLPQVHVELLLPHGVREGVWS